MQAILIILCSLLVGAAHAHQVIGISDGDTLTLLIDRQPVRVRLANIDAPEKRQAFGERSKQALSALCFRRDAEFATVDRDRYGRTVATVKCAGVDVNHRQVETVMAWTYTRYNKDARLPVLQEAARRKGAGLWADREPVPPWEFRRAARAQ
jgi:micrococcal nuclease